MDMDIEMQSSQEGGDISVVETNFEDALHFAICKVNAWQSRQIQELKELQVLIYFYINFLSYLTGLQNK
jgi:hypothetical protein